MLVCELCASSPQACSTRSMKLSSPGRPTWYITSWPRPSRIAVPMRPPTSASAWSQVIRSQPPSPRRPARFSGYRIRSGS